MKEITHDDLIRRLVAGENISILDIREADEFDDWHISGASNLPLYNTIASGDYGTVEKVLRSTTLDKNMPVVAVCREGATSRIACQALAAIGYDAASLNGGMRDWSNAWTEAPIAADGMTLIQVRRNGKGCLSYVLGNNSEAVVVDPCVGVETYISVTERNGFKITHVMETHVHADHISRAPSLAEATGAKLVLPKNDRVNFDYTAVQDGDTITVGGLSIAVVSTPGHTGESVCYDVEGRVLLSGDTVFADNIGRPDLERGDAGAATGAGLLYDSLHGRVLNLSDSIIVCPGHTSDAIGFDGDPICASLGDIKPKVDLLKLDRDAFVSTVTASLGQKPPNFERVIAVNEGKMNLGWLDPLELEAGPNRCAVK